MRIALLGASLLLAAIVNAQTPEEYKRVDLDLFVMSKCPDALYCEGALTDVLADLKDIISLNMHFIGQKQDDGTWKCKHGDAECAGDLQQLCVQLNSKLEQRYDWLYKFVLCNNKQGLDAIGSFSTAALCLKEAGVPFSPGTAMMGCMYAPGHDSVIASDFAQTAALGVSTSCTIQVEGNTVCVRDGGEWKECPAGTDTKDFKQLFCAAFAAKNEGHMPPTCRPSVVQVL
eukprot:GHUV01002246.1.p1 GENE.GHUV01002246.1~~GHUV01002246.1.p1  ORF type:complete len:230 (+),score=58.23 GHUV01002246.1:101-790(+)